MKRKTRAKLFDDRDQAKENKYQRRTLPKADLRQLDVYEFLIWGLKIVRISKKKNLRK